MTVTVTSSYQDIVSAIINVMRTNLSFTDNDIQTRVDLDNQDFKPLNNNYWLRVSILHNIGDQESQGNPAGLRCFSDRGVGSVQIFVHADQGLSELNRVGGEMQGALRKVNLGSIFLSNISYSPLGRRDDSKWYQSNVTFEFRYSSVL